MSIDPINTIISRIKAVAAGSTRIEARLLLEAAKGDPHTLEAMVRRRLAGEPVDRITGSRGFWTLELLVTPDVLSPRPDTETIVELARDLARQRNMTGQPLRILDLGTGSGAILLALLSELKQATGLGIDISHAAVDVAKRNAEINGLTARAAFQCGSWGEDISERFDIIVSNPPYIPTADITDLETEVRDHDPVLALDGGADGLDPYRQIFPQLHRLLKPQGFAVFEIGYDQNHSIPALAKANTLVMLELKNDLSMIPRALALSVTV